MKIINNHPYIDLVPVEKQITNSDLIEKIRNLQDNIIFELRNINIDFDYINECQSEIKFCLEEIKSSSTV